MLHREYISTGENLHFLSEVCKQKVCLTTKRRMEKEMQVVGGPSSTEDGRNKINTGGKSRELFLTALACETISKRKH